MIILADVDPLNWRLELKVAEDQKKFVSDSYAMLARAFAYREFRSRAFVIYNDETPVGMAMFHDCEPLKAYDLSQLFIDQRYQGLGYGKTATQKILNLMRQDGKYHKVVLCYIEGNDVARNLYEAFGFQITDRDENEIIMELVL